MKPLKDQASEKWRATAACKGAPPEIFFPEDDGDPSLAIAVCEGCQVRWDCLDAALHSNETDGVWGGLTAEERKNLKRRRTRKRELFAIDIEDSIDSMVG